MEITFDSLPKETRQLRDEVKEMKQLVMLLYQHFCASPNTEAPLTIKEASKVINLAVPTIYSLVSQGAIPYSKKGKRLYFSKQELFEWVKSGRKKTNQEIQAEAESELATIGRRGL